MDFTSPILLFITTFIFVCLCSALIWRERWQPLADLTLHCAVILLGISLQTIQKTNFSSRELEPLMDNEPVILFGSVDSEPAPQDRRMILLYGQTASFVTDRWIERHEGS